jgi:uncharacterized membrane protein
MLFRAPESHPRSLLKAISWRILGSIDTFVLSLLFTHKPFLAASIAGTETITKILLYYFHERAWAAVPWGHRRAAVEPERPEAAPAPAPALAPVQLAD